MIRGKIAKILMLAIIVSMPMSSLAQKKFDVYGFMDFKYRKRFMEENNFFQTQTNLLSRESQMFIGNLNTYFDFNPNEYTRTLIELNLNANTYDKSRVAGLEAELSAVGEASILNQVYQGAYSQAYTTLTGMGLPDIIAAPMADSIADEEVAANGPTYVAGAQQQLAGVYSPYEGGTKYGGFKIERAWFDITPFNVFNIRVGRFLTPAGIWNVDHGSPLIITIGQPNEVSLVPIFPNAQTGIMGYGSVFLGDHDFTYKVYVSTGRDDDNARGTLPIDEFKDMGVGGNLKFNFDVIEGLGIGLSAYTGVDKNKQLVGKAVIDDPTSPIVDKFEFEWVDGNKSREIDLGADFKATVKGISLQAETNIQLSKNLYSDTLMTPIIAFYTLLSYDWFINKNFGITPYFFFERISWEDPEESPQAGVVNYPFLGWNQFTGGLNFRLFSNVRLKMEYNFAALEQLNNPLIAKSNDSSVEQINTSLQNEYKDGDLNIKSIAVELSIAF